MNKQFEIVNRVRELRKARGLTQEQLAERIGEKAKAQISKIENGGTMLNTYWINALAKALEVSPADLIAEQEQRQVPVVGEVGAGEKFFPFDDFAPGCGFDMVDEPENCTDCVAVKIRGESMRPLKPGWLVFYERYADGVPPECINELCVVKCFDESMMLKVVKAGSLPHHYHLASWNESYKPILDQKLLWASKIKSIRTE